MIFSLPAEETGRYPPNGTLIIFKFAMTGLLIFCILSAAQAITNNYHAVTDYNLRRLDGGLVTRMDHLESKLRVSFNADGQTFESDLELNHDLYNDYAQDFPKVAYKGKLDGLDGYMRFTVLAPHEFHAMIKLESGDIWIIDPTHRHLTQASSAMVAYHTDDVMDTEVQHRLRSLIGESEYGRLANCNYGGSNKMQISYGIAADAGYVAKFGGEQGARNQISSIFNTVSALYADQLGVHMKLGALRMYTTTGGSSPSWNMQANVGSGCRNDGFRYNIESQLDAFKSWVGSGRAPACGDQDCGFWHLLTNCGEDRNRYGNVAGVAFVGTVCQIRGYGAATGVSIDIPSQSWVVVGHEIGHNFGSSHSNRGIMSYDPNAIKKFYPENSNVCSVIKSNIGRCISEYQAATAPVEDVQEEKTATAPPQTDPPVVYETPAPTADGSKCRPVYKTPVPAPKPCSRRVLTQVNTENRDFGTGPCACLSIDQVRPHCPSASEDLCFVSPTCKEFDLSYSADICPAFHYRHRSLYEIRTVGTWRVGSWSKCSKACGSGLKTRAMDCVNSQGQVVDDSQCPGTKPVGSTETSCNAHSCLMAQQDQCQTPSFATCKNAGLSGSCECTCNDGYFFDDAFASCRSSTAPSSDVFFVASVTGLHSLACTEGALATEHQAASTGSSSVGSSEVAVFILAGVILATLGFAIVRAVRQRRAASKADLLRASVFTL